MKMSHNWLDNLEKGDPVIDPDGRIQQVERTTKTLIVVAGAKYKRRTGELIPEGCINPAWLGSWPYITEYKRSASLGY